MDHRGTARATLAALLALLLFLPALTRADAPSLTEIRPPAAETPAVVPARTAVAVYGDSRSDPATHARVVAAIGRGEPSAVFHLGDMTASGTSAAQWREFNEAVAALRAGADFYPVVGNHERSWELYVRHVAPPGNARWYSVRKADVTFVVLDTNTSLRAGSEQLKWLEAELAAATRATPYTVVLGHHSPYTTGAHHPDDEKEQRKTVVPLLERHGVQLYLAAHTHHYERSWNKGIFYVVTGGGGAPLYEQARTSPYSQRFASVYHFCRLWVADGKLQLEAQDLQGRVIDRLALEPRRATEGSSSPRP